MQYDVVVLGAAQQVIRELPEMERVLVAQSLATDLSGVVDENTAIVNLATSDYLQSLGHVYFGTVLSAGYVAIYRPLTTDEVDRQEEAGGRRFASEVVFAVLDLIDAASRPSTFVS